MDVSGCRWVVCKLSHASPPVISFGLAAARRCPRANKACVFPVFLIEFSFLSLKQYNSWYAFILWGLFWDLCKLLFKYLTPPPKKKSESIFSCVLAAVWDEQLRAGGIITELFKDMADVCLASLCDSLNWFNSGRHQCFFFFCTYWHHWSVSFEQRIQVYPKQLTIHTVTWSTLFSHHPVWVWVRKLHQNRKLGSKKKNRQVRPSQDK